MGGADDVRPVPDADAGVHGRAVLQDKGVVIGGKTGSRDLTAHNEVLHILGGGDIAVDKHTGHVALCVSNQDGLDLALGHLDAHHIALEGDELAQDGVVIDLFGGDHLGLYGRSIADLLDPGNSQLALALVGAGGAADTDLIADLEIACHREAVDAAGFILDIDAVKEGGVLIVAGGVGGDDALDGVLDALLLLGLDLGDGGDLDGVDYLQQVLHDGIVGVKQVSAGINILRLDLELPVCHHCTAGHKDHTVAADLFRSEQQEFAIIFGHGCAAEAVAVPIAGGSGGIAVYDRRYRGRNRADGRTVFIHNIHRAAAILAEHLRVLGVKRRFFAVNQAL